MTISEIVKKVRWCIDEETQNDALLDGVDGNDDALMDNIIKAKICDSLRWILLYAPLEMLEGKDEATTTDMDYITTTISGADIIPGNPTRVKLPHRFLKLLRVRLKDWHRSVRVPIEEDSDEYLELNNETAGATVDRPVAAIIRTSPMELELWPGNTTETELKISFVNAPDEQDYSGAEDTAKIAIPQKAKTAFIYYIAFLVMCAYRDNATAESMLAIAKMNLGIK